MKKRLFIAVDVKPDPELSRFFSQLKITFHKENIKWASQNIFHLTLKFLGETRESRIEGIAGELAGICSTYSPFSFKVKGLGYFGARKAPRVLFSEIEGAEILKELSMRINEKLAELGFEKEQKAFRAHLTLGRIKHISDKAAFFSEIENKRDVFLQDVKIDEIILYESILKPQGPDYMVIRKFPLESAPCV